MKNTPKLSYRKYPSGEGHFLHAIVAKNNNNRIIAERCSEVIAEEIVRACNTHDDLIQLVKEMMKGKWSDCNDRRCRNCSYCRARTIVGKEPE